jgi:hypothetical protein
VDGHVVQGRLVVIFILAKTSVAAQELAASRGLYRDQWAWLNPAPAALLSHDVPVVLAAEGWDEEMNSYKAWRMRQHLRITEAEVTYV